MPGGATIIVLLLVHLATSHNHCFNFSIQIEEVANSEEVKANTCSAEACEIDARNKPKCMCLVRRESCCTHCSVCQSNTSNSTELGFCEDVLCDLGYSVVTDDVNGSVLSKTMMILNKQLSYFEQVLNRTIVGVYLENVDQRNACLVS